MTESLLCSSDDKRIIIKNHKAQIFDSNIAPKPLIHTPRIKSTRRVAPATSSEHLDYKTTTTTTGACTDCCCSRNDDYYPKREKLLPNGDLYIGTFSGKSPHGSGKYLWADGCMYQGDWKNGKASGKGKFSWPSGATFEGKFKAGKMDGIGTFIGQEGDMYQGDWLCDRKHGYGVKHYSNGDCYEGNWMKNVQDGQGRYVWKNGNEYVGEWRNGVIHGRGVLIWPNGNRFDGNWENGVIIGQGVFTWPNGSCYIGSWTKDDDHQIKNQTLKGTFYPGLKGQEPPFRGSESYPGKAGLSENFLGISAAAFRSSNVGGKEKGSSLDLPRICIWEESDEEGGDITCEVVDDIGATSSSNKNNGIKQFRKNPCFCGGNEVKKPGETISKGHKHYDLMLNLQLGIRHSIGKDVSKTRELKASDFDPKEKFWTKFSPQGSKNTPSHHSLEFKWKDYCPMVFRHLRKIFEVDPGDYMLAICGNDALRELSSPGKSGCFFYLTQDDRFILKTVKKSEVKVLVKMLPRYYDHLRRYENSLVTKFYGAHCVKPTGGVKTRFIVMGNLFCSEYRIHKRFDLKGSSHGRKIDKPEEEIDETTTLKDLDLNFLFRVQPEWYQELIKQIDRDCRFLETEKIMDYSLLIGIHFRSDIMSDKIGLRKGDDYSYQVERLNRGKPLIRLGGNMPARAEKVERRSDLIASRNGEIYDAVLYFGIIDILQDYDITKKLEHAYKSLHADPASISAVDPKHYSKRFQDLIGKIFIEDR